VGEGEEVGEGWKAESGRRRNKGSPHAENVRQFFWGVPRGHHSKVIDASCVPASQHDCTPKGLTNFLVCGRHTQMPFLAPKGMRRFSLKTLCLSASASLCAQ